MPRLSEPPSLAQLRHQAKDLLKSIRSGDPSALETLAAAPPSDPAVPVRLADAQRALARSYGFPSWAKLKTHVDSYSHWPALRDAIRSGDTEEAERQLRAIPALRAYRPTNNATDLLAFAAQENQIELVSFFPTIPVCCQGDIPMPKSIRPSWGLRSRTA